VTQRKNWNDQTAFIEQSFQKALELGTEAASLFDSYLDLQDETNTLNSHWINWNKNRFEIVVVGEFSTGKSTFINALLRKEVLPSKVTPTTATINYIRHIEQGDGTEKAVIHFFNGEEKAITFEELEEYVTEMSKKLRVVDEVAYVDLFVDSPYLKDGVVIVDTPGLQALHPEHERITKEQIKKSNASILLFNMEQPGKKSEFIFLKDLSDSIERIFFVGNRMDGVPEEEIQEVIHSLETSLRENEYQPVPYEQAKLYPISALQALKGRDPNVKTKHWNDWSSEKLIKTSLFPAFEERLEDYLFNGEKAKDLLKSPFLALFHFYESLKEKVAQIEVMVSGEISIDLLEAEKKRLTEEVELRKLQLQDKERNIKNNLQDAVYQHEKAFNERRQHVQQYLIDRLNDIDFIEDLAEEVSTIMIDLNKEIEQLVDESLHDLSNHVELSMRREIADFELGLQSEVGLNIQALTEREISVSNSNGSKDYTAIMEEIDKNFLQEEERLLEEKKSVHYRKKLENELRSSKDKQELLKESQQSETRFHELLLNSTDSTKKQYDVIKHRRFWFNKMGMIDVPNERYDELVREKKELLKRQSDAKFKMYEEIEGINNELAQSTSEFHDIQDYYEAKRELQRRKEEERIQRIKEMTKAESRQLDRERKKVAREIENIFDSVKREYRNLLRGLDALKLAQQSIENYIQDKDLELNQKLNELQAKEELLNENAAKQEKYKSYAQSTTEKVDTETENLSTLFIKLI
jgi:GTPase SAR1 family protein